MVVRGTVGDPSKDGIAPGRPRFRLTYTKREGGTLAIKFEMAPPGTPDAFRTYLEGPAARDAKQG